MTTAAPVAAEAAVAHGAALRTGDPLHGVAALRAEGHARVERLAAEGASAAV